MTVVEAVALKENAAPRVHQWTREEYYRLDELGLFEQRGVELIEGVILDVSPMRPERAAAIGLVKDTLRTVFGQGWVLRTQLPLSLADKSEPQPDVAIVQGTTKDYRKAHPTTAVLVVEVSDTTLEYDRTVKASLYARADVPDYWILNLRQRQLEVRRAPQPDPLEPMGFGYATKFTLGEGDTVNPLARPEATIAVADLLP